MTNPTLTPKQRSFVDNYLANGCNGTQAAKAAGYKGNDNTLASIAKDNLRKPHIKSEIDAEREKLQKNLGATAENKRALLWEAANRCMQAEPVYEFSNGEKIETGEYKFDSAGVVRSIAELNRMDGDHAAIKIKAKVEAQIDYVAILEEARDRARKAKNDE